MGSFYVLQTVFSALSEEVFLIVCASVVIICFTVEIFLTVFRAHAFIKRTWCVAVAVCAFALLKFRALLLEETDASYLILAISGLLAVPILCVKGGKKQNFDGKKFVKFIDEKIKEGENDKNKTEFPPEDTNISYAVERLRAEPYKEREKPKEPTCEIDFSHVKTVLQRLEFSPLTPSDRRQIHDLELYLADAESGKGNAEIRAKINEGLGNLLKIMAKHGV